MSGFTSSATFPTTLTDVSGSRAANTVYQAGTAVSGRYVFFALKDSGGAVDVDIYVGPTSSPGQVLQTDTRAANVAGGAMVWVPPGYYYKINTGGGGTTIAFWWESS
ncbi:MAG: hypothetical protein ABR585_14255 [Gemmatimonadaceae bacterium]